ncbi:MAG: ornithine cyclodeaminase family protein [bacterium]
MPVEIITLSQIKKTLASIDLLPAIEAGFVAYSTQQAVVPPVGELLLEKGEVHIKYGYIKQNEYYVVKIASGFYGNPKLGLASGNGLMLLFSQQTGELVCILLDQGHLTDTRTAVAGAIAAKYLAPKRIEQIGIVGTGIQARLQLSYLRNITGCREVLVFGRGKTQLARYRSDMEKLGFEINTTVDAADIINTCNLIVTTTPATKPLLHARDLRPGVHITAVGSDTPTKQELDTAILARADSVVADSISQCRQRGEIHQALKAGRLTEDKIVELGNILAGRIKGRTSEEQITVVDLTGVAVQDIKIAAAVYTSFKKDPENKFSV